MSVKDKDMEPLLINYSAELAVSFSGDALCASLTGELCAEILAYLSNETEVGVGTSLSILENLGLVPSPGGFGVTVFGKNLLLDEQGHHALRVLTSVYERLGVEAALQRLETLRQREFNPQLLQERAEMMAQTVITRLDLVGTFGNHLRCLNEIVNELHALIGSIEPQIAQSERRASEIEARLRATRSSAQPGGTSGETTSRWRALRRYAARLNQLVRPLVGQELATAPNHGAALEGELIRSQLRLSVLRAEALILRAIANLLGSERQLDESSLAFLKDARHESLNSARRAEATRNYDFAAGEILLNGDELTGATVEYLFGRDGREAFVLNTLSSYARAHGGEELLSATSGVITQQIVAELEGLVRSLIEPRMNKFTITDALVALYENGKTDLLCKLTEAFKATASLAFLAPHYANHLDPQVFTVVTCAPGGLPRANASLFELMGKIRNAVQLRFEVEPDYAEPERLLFYCEYFCLPLDAFRFYEESTNDFEVVKAHPRYNPHPEIHRCLG